MADTTRKSIPLIDPQMVSALLSKRDALLAERTSLRKKQLDLATRDREIDRELADLQAAGRVFSIAVDLPKETADSQRQYFTDAFPTYFRGGVGKSTTMKSLMEAASNVTAAAKAVATKAEMPRVSDVVLDRLRAAGEVGSKAAPIQAYIESTYGTKIHDKTVGMTLYRLQRDGHVRHHGHTWFVVSGTTNPAGETAGSKKSAT